MQVNRRTIYYLDQDRLNRSYFRCCEAPYHVPSSHRRDQFAKIK